MSTKVNVISVAKCQQKVTVFFVQKIEKEIFGKLVLTNCHVGAIL